VDSTIFFSVKSARKFKKQNIFFREMSEVPPKPYCHLTSFFLLLFLELPTDRDTVTGIEFLADFSSQERGFDSGGRGSVSTNGQYRMSGGFYSTAGPKCHFHIQRSTSQNPTQDTH
jgi:hypothetical protein